MATQVMIRCKYSGNKFIVLENEKGEIVVFADDDRRFRLHKELLQQYCEETGLSAKCLGGGYIHMKEKSVSLTGTSTDFGTEPNRDETVTAIKEVYPEYVVKGNTLVIGSGFL